MKTHFYSSKEREIISSATPHMIRSALTELGWKLRDPVADLGEGKSVEIWTKLGHSCRVVDHVYPDWKYRQYELVENVIQAEDISSYEFCNLLDGFKEDIINCEMANS